MSNASNESAGGAQPPYRDLTEQAEVEALMASDGGAVVLDFWSETCGPCLAMADDFAAVAAQFNADEVQFVKINTGRHGHLAAPFNVMAVPTILFVLNGQILDSMVGRPTARKLGERAEWLVKKSQSGGLFKRLFGRG